MRRSVGYCTNEICEGHGRGDFLLNHESYTCPRCRQPGHQEQEGGQIGVGSNMNSPFREVRVRFNYSPSRREYLETAIITDESLVEGNIYILQSPLIKTTARALKVAEAILGNLNRYGLMNGELPAINELTLSFDAPMPEFRHQLTVLADTLSKSKLADTA